MRLDAAFEEAAQASPLRALDCCGPIWREALFTRERGWMVLVVGLLRAVWTGRKPAFGHTRRLSSSRGALSPAGP